MKSIALFVGLALLGIAGGCGAGTVTGGELDGSPNDSEVQQAAPDPATTKPPTSQPTAPPAPPPANNPPTPVPPPVVIKDTFTNYANNQFQTHCRNCHIQDFLTLAEINDPTRRVKQRILERTMPPRARIPQADFDRIKAWFDDGTPQ